MALLIEDKLLFIRIPKTGGVWIKSVIKMLGLKTREVGHAHWHASVSTEIYNLMCGGMPAFTIVRHPLTWYQSYWAYKRQIHGDNINKLFAPAIMWHPTWVLDTKCDDTDFQKFIDNCLKYCPSYLTHLFHAYVSKPPETTSNGSSWFDTLDYVGCIEKLCAELAYVLNRFRLIDGDTAQIEKRLRECPQANVTEDRHKNAAKYRDIDQVSSLLRSESGIVAQFNYNHNPLEFANLIGGAPDVSANA